MEVKRSYRPLIAVILISAFACGFTALYFARAQTIVRAPCVLYPAGYYPLQSPIALGRVTDVLKANGDSVAFDEPILVLDTEDEKLQIQVNRQKVAGLQEQIKENARLIDVRKATLEQAKEAEKQALVAVDIEKKHLVILQAMLKRVNPANIETEIKFAAEKLVAAEKAQAEAKRIYESRKELLKSGSVTEDQFHVAEFEYLKDQSIVLEKSFELKLLKEGDAIFRQETAQAEVERAEATIKNLEAVVQVKGAEVKIAAAAVDIDVVARKLQAEVDTLNAEVKRLERIIKERVLHAPCAGFLNDFRIQKGQWITDKTALGTIYDTSSLVVYAHVQQKDFNKIQKGQKARIMFDGISPKEGPVEAEVLSLETLATPPKNDEIEPTAIFQEPLKGAWTPRALVKLKLIEPAVMAKLHVGFTGAVKILIDPTNPTADWFFYKSWPF
jgi:multidrug resistance efflux pump